MPANATPERRALLELYGATIIDSPGELGSNGAVRMAQEIAERDDRYVMLFQYGNEANPRAHYEGTGAEIARELPRVDALVAGLGTGGTLMGTGARLREAFPGVQIVAARTVAGRPGDGPALARGRLRAADPRRRPARPEAARLERRGRSRGAVLLDREGLFAGVSAGAVVHVARRIADELPEGSIVVAVLADGGWKYLSAGFWSGEEIDEAVLWW